MARAALHAMGSRETSQLISEMIISQIPESGITEDLQVQSSPEAHKLHSLNRTKRRSGVAKAS